MAVRLPTLYGLQMGDISHNLIRSQTRMPLYVRRRCFAFDLEWVYLQPPKPSEYFRFLADLGALEILIAPLNALQNVPAGPEKSRHECISAFDHTMEAIDRAKAYGYGFGVFLAVLCHDFGKGTTPPEILPHHYGHEERSEEIAKKWLGQNFFREDDKGLAIAFARDHMRVHLLEEMRPARLIRFIKAIPQRYFEDIFKAGNCDSPLNERQWQILRALKRARTGGIGTERQVG